MDVEIHFAANDKMNVALILLTLQNASLGAHLSIQNTDLVLPKCGYYRREMEDR